MRAITTRRVVIKLTTKEIICGATMGVLRQVENLKLGRAPAHGAGASNDWQIHIEGCLGEFAAAKELGRFPFGMPVFRGSDLGGNLEVRTRSASWYDLILHPEDHDDARYVLVTGVNGEYDVRGWILGRDGKLDKYWADPAGGRPAFFVPQKALQPLSAIYLPFQGED